MAQTIQLVVNTGKPQTTQTFDLMQGGVQGQAVRIQAVRGARYQLQDPAAKNTAPKNLRTKRVGKNLHLMLDGSTASDLIIEGYYDLPAEAGGQGSVYGRAEDGKLYEYVPQDSGASHTPMALNDGAPAVSQTLGGLEIEDYELSTLPVVATGGGLGGLTAGVLGAAAASAKGSQKTDETAAAGLAKIEAYNNGNGTTPAALTVQDYTDAGVTGVTANNLAAVNAQVLAAATGGADTVAELQSLVTAANNAIAKIEAYNNGDGITPPALTLQDYVAAGVSGVNANNLAAVNAQVLAASTGGADTVPEMQTLVTAANTALAKIEAYNNGDGTTPAALTETDYRNAGITGVNAGNLAAVNAKILGSSTGSTDSATAVQNLVTALNDALVKIEAYNNGDGITPPALTAQDYADAGVTGVSADNLAAVNAQVLAQARGGADTASEVQTLVTTANNALAKIEAYNNGDGTTPAALTETDYRNAGITGVNAGNLAAVNAKVLGSSTGSTDSATAVQNLVTALNDALVKIEAYNNGDGITPPALTAQDYADAGVTGVSADNLAAVNAQVLAQARGGADTASEVQTLVTTANNALAKIEAYNNGDGTTPAALTETDYRNAGITGVNAGNLAAVNAKVLGSSTGTTDSATAVQNLVTALNDALVKIEAYNNGDGITPPALTAQDYADAGVTGVSADNLAAVNAQVLAQARGGADTASEVQDLVTAANAALAKIEAYNNGDGTTPAALTVADYQAAAITGVTPENVAAVNAKVLAQAAGGANTVAEIQAIANGINNALVKIEAYNNGDGTTPYALSLQDYANAGVTGVTADNLAAVNAQVLAQATGGADSVGEIQALVTAANNALAKIEAYNHGDGTTPAALSVQDYADAGIVGVYDGNLNAVNASVLAGATGDADTVSEIQTLVAAAGNALAKIEAYNNGDGHIPSPLTLQDFVAAGVTGVSVDNFAAVNAQVLAANTGEADTGPEVQALVTAANNALAKIEAYNNGNGTTPAALTVADYVAAGISGVSADNVAAVNAKLLAASTGGADTGPEIQAFANAVNDALVKIEAYNNGNGITPVALTIQDYEDAGITGVTAQNLAAVNAQVLRQSAGGANSVSDVQTLVDAAAAALAKIEAYNNGDGTTPAALTVTDYQAAGVTGVNTDNVAAVNANVLAQSAGGADTVDDVQALANAVNNALAKIEAYNNGDGITPSALTVQDYVNAGITGVNASNLVAVNAQVLAQSTGGADSCAEVQALVTAASNALAKIEAYNNGDGTTPAALTLADYQAAGITGVSTDNLAAVNAKVLAQSTGGADTVSDVQTLVNAVNTAITKVEAYNNGDGVTPSALTAQDYADAGVSGVSSANLAAVNAQVFAQNAGGADSVGEIQALVTAANNALAKIEAYNNGDGTTPVALTVADYQAAGITGVSSDNLAAVNAKVLAQSTGGADAVSEIQNLVNAANAALAKIEAYNNGDGVTPQALSLTDYQAAGITGVTAENLVAVNAQVLAQNPGGADTVGEVQALVTAAIHAVAKIEAYNNGDGTTPAALTVADYQAAGITGVTNNNLAVVNAQVLAQSAGAADTCPEVQALVTTVVAAFTASLNAIATYAETGVTAPTVSDYTQVGVVGVTAGNLAAINSAINAQAGADSIVGNANDRDGADTAAEVQTIVSAYNAILQAADGVDNTANSANPTTAQYASVGVTGVSTAAHVSLLGDTIDTQASAAVDTVAKVQALADAALAVLTGAANGTAPTLAQLQLLGLGDVSANNIASVQAAIAATANDGSEVDTWAELQALISGVNDPAIIGGDTAKALVEANAALSASGTLTITDVDSPATFVAQANTAGSNNYGTFSLDIHGAWTYTMGSAHNEFVAGTDYTDRFTAISADGTTQVVTVTISGTNDAVVISGVSTAALTETNAAQTTTGTLIATDVDGTDNTFVAQTNAAGSNGYGAFSVTSAGVWTYTMGSAHDEFVSGQSYTDSLTVAAADGTTQVVTVTLTGTNDAAVISGVSTAALTETNAAQTATGTLTSNDVDGAANLFTAQSNVAGSNGYGTFSVTTGGVWTYTMGSAHDEFVGGSTYTDSLTVAAADGTTQVVTVTITGTNDAAVIGGVSTAALTETNAAQTATGTLTSTDADGTANLFTAQTNVAGSNGYGTFSITTGGAWTYTMSPAHDEFLAGSTHTDNITVAAADGTTQVVTVTITGTNDAAVISGVSTAALTETNAAQTATGTLTSTDVDGTANLFTAQSNVAGSNGYGTFSVTTGGVWTYTMGSAHDEFVGSSTYTDSLTVAAADGTTQVVTVTISGTNDAVVISGVSTAALTENNAAQTTTGTLIATDVDGTDNTFVAQTNVAGSNGYGAFSVTSSGVWNYTMGSAHDEFVAGSTYTDSITVAAADGITQVVTVTITGTNDAAVISGTSTAALTETNAAQTATGTLTSSDVDGTANLFTAQSNVAGSNGYGAFSVTSAGVWTYTMSSAYDEFVGSSTYTDSITVAAADGTTQVVTVTITGTNDSAVISGTSTAVLTETNAAQTATGTLTSSDVDGTANLFTAQTNVAGSNGYGTFGITTGGVWTYIMSSAHDEFVGGQSYTDSITVAAADGTTQVVTVTITGTNDAVVISGVSAAALTETNVAQTTTGTLIATDVDGTDNTFVAQTNVAGSNGYGAFSVTSSGVWTYTMGSAHDEFVGGSTYTDSITAAAADGTTQVVTVTLTGTNDAAVISGVSTAALTETNAAQTATGTLTSSDVDGTANLFTTQTNVAGSNGYGTFGITTGGVWTYTMSSAHDEFAGSSTYTDSLTVAAADGTTQVVTVTITGVNDAAVISGTSTAALTETNAAQTATGTLTSTDVDGTANLFTAQTNAAGSNSYGTFSVTTGGVWTYTMNSAHDEFVAGSTHTDSITVAAADGTTQVVTVTLTGTNDAAVISGVSTAALTETNAAQTATGTLTSTDVDGTVNLFTAQTNVAGSNGYGTFGITTGGAWTYTMGSAHDEFVAGSTYTDSITVAAADGTTQVVTVTITGTNDAAVISGTSTAALTETNAAQTATGTLTSTDVDGTANLFTAQTNVAGSNGYGSFGVTSSGVWTYTMGSAHDEFVGGQSYIDSITVAAADGTTQVVTVTLTGSNDAPTNTVPGAQTAVEDTQLAITGLSVNDVDGNLATAKLTVLHGNLNVSITGGATISAGANDSATVTLSGTQAQINLALATLKYTGALNYNGADTLTVLSTDSDGTPLTDSDNIAITVSAVNDAPTLTVTSSGGTYSGGTAVTAFSASSVDVGGSLAESSQTFIKLGLTVSGLLDGSNEKLTIDGSTFSLTNATTGTTTTNGFTYTVSVTGSTATVTLTKAAGVTTALFDTMVKSIAYSDTAASRSSGNRVITITTVQDNGGVTNGGVDTATFNFTSTIMTTGNTAPVNTVPGAQTASEDTQLAITGISVTDADSNLATTKLTVLHGTLNVDITGGATISAGTNNSATLTLSGTQTQINAALATLKYTGVSNYNGSDTLTVLSTDSAGVPLTDSDTVAITVTAVNDQPTAAAYANIYPNLEDSGAPVNGTTLGITIGSISSFAGKDPEGVSVGVAIAAAIPSANGTVWYSLDGGATWLNLTTASATASMTNAFLLSSTARLYVQANPNLSSMTNITASRLWDGSDGATSGSYKDISALTGASGAYAATDTTLYFGATSVNDVPTLTATAVGGNYTGTAVSAFSTSNVSAGPSESSQAFIKLGFTVSGLADGASEQITVDGSTFSLTDATTGTTATNSFTYNVSVTSTTATVTLSKAAALGVTKALFDTMVNSIAFSDTSATPTTGNRVITITTVQDNGGVTNGGIDTNTGLTLTSTVNVTQPAGVDLGSAGLLVGPVQIEGHWYYWWDMSGASNTLNGGVDYTTQQNLASIFKYDINGNLNPGSAMSEAYRYAILNGVTVALPTVNGGDPFSAGSQTGTSATGQTSTFNANTKYSDMLAIWDAFNGTTTGTGMAGYPTGWTVGGGSFWAVQTSGANAYVVGLNNGNVTLVDPAVSPDVGYRVGLEVIKANHAPVLDASASPAFANSYAASTGPANGNTTSGELLSSLIGSSSITDADAGALKGIAITGVNAGGTLYYSLNGGTTWSAAASVSATNALHLAIDSDTRVFFQSNASLSVTDAFTFRAWDQTFYNEGFYGDVSFADAANLNGKTNVSSYSSNTDTVAANVTLAPLVGTTLDLGTVNGVRWNLIQKLVVNGMTYFFVDLDGSGVASSGDYSGNTHDDLDTIFNGGANTTGTTNPTEGQDTERSAIINGYTLVLPTLVELQAIRTAAGNALPTGWGATYNYWASDSASTNTHKALNFSTGTATSSYSDTNSAYLVVQVLPIPVAPVVLDLNRDGTLSYSQVVMDVNGDGLLDQTAWAGAPDGVLVWDKYADGLVHDASQYAFAQYGGNSDLQGLAAGFDTHQDGKFDAQDAKFAEFKVWQDLNQNGISDAGEVRSLADWGITEIKLSSDGVVRTPAAGVTEAGRTTATTTDGTSILVADAGFDNASLDYSVTPAATPGGAKLNVLGSGMSLDLSRFIAQHGAMAEVDLSGTGANTLTLRLNDVLQGTASTLKVTGDANDVLNAQLAAEWTDSGAVVTDNGHSYAVYNANANAAAQLLIDQQLLSHAV